MTTPDDERPDEAAPVAPASPPPPDAAPLTADAPLPVTAPPPVDPAEPPAVEPPAVEPPAAEPATQALPVPTEPVPAEPPVALQPPAAEPAMSEPSVSEPALAQPAPAAPEPAAVPSPVPAPAADAAPAAVPPTAPAADPAPAAAPAAAEPPAFVGVPPTVPAEPAAAVAPEPSVPASDPAPVDEDPAPTSTQTPDSEPGSRRPTVLLLGALLLLALLAAGVTVLALKVREGRQTETAREQAVSASRDAARLLFSYDHTTLDQDFARGLAVTTGEFRKEYTETTEQVVREVALEYKAVVLADVVESAVVSATPDRVTTIVFLNQATTSTRVEGQQVDASRVRMTLVERDGRWLVTDVDAL